MWQRFRRHLRLSLAIPTLDSRSAYRKWADCYPATAHNLLMQVETQAMLALMPPLSANTVVIDLACGTGRWGRWVASQSDAQIIGLDNSYPMLRHAKYHYTAVADMATLPLAAVGVDLVICGLALGHLSPEKMPLALREIGRILKPSGTALISDLHPFQAWNGAKRTFQAADGKTYAVEHHIHSYQDYHEAAQSAGLRITGVREPSRPDLPAPTVPVVLVLRLEK